MSQEASGSPSLSYASSANAAFIDGLYSQYQSDPESVDVSWQRFFQGYELALSQGAGATGQSSSASPRGTSESDKSGDDQRTNAQMEGLINAYRRLGHLSADLDPLSEQQHQPPEMSPEAHGLGGVDPSRKFHPANLPLDEGSLKEILALLTKTYCGRIGADFREINDIGAVVWFQNEMEQVRNQPQFDQQLKKRIFEKLTTAEHFEQFLGRRYIGAKRFSLEGADSLIPLLDTIANEASQAGVEELCLGMAHRGRLNVLANFMGKSYEQMLKEFEGSDFNPFDIDGDVKYHQGFASEVETASGKAMRLYLSPNPSHLEIVNPVVEGFVRCRQRLLQDEQRRRVVPILMHGDAAFIGQGVVAETINLSHLPHYETGGTIHIIINNQIGFTTEPSESRSCAYASDIIKMVRAPVLHVNADDPEAVVWCAHLAVAYRQKFGGDVVIDLIGYRRHGHNEGDEPAFTQPKMYQVIAKHPTALAQYQKKLAADGTLTESESKKVIKTFKDRLQSAYEKVHGKNDVELPKQSVPKALQPSVSYRPGDRAAVDKSCKTGVSETELQRYADTLTSSPEGFKLNKKLDRLLNTRRSMMDGEGNIDWGFGELLALASLAAEGKSVRLSGQDTERGTFTSRHAVFTDRETAEHYEPLQKIATESKATVQVINSPLSEQGCLGFEFGYSVADPDSLVAWEAQFGDFCNGAQIVIDQFLSASEAKWKQTSGLVLLLPHGHEGQGPEHSSARPERFLQLCGNLNMQVVIPTTPAQHFHVLRRQLGRVLRKPLIVMTPKSLLRHPQAVSQLDDFTNDLFHEVLPDPNIGKSSKVERIIACSGKIYYELFKARTEYQDADTKVPIIRLEQLYPFPYQRIQEIFATYPKLKEIVWTQEEPQNMGGWNFVRGRFSDILEGGQTLQYIGRKNSGTPAEGSAKAHEQEQRRIIQDALSLAMNEKIRAVKGTAG